MSLYRTNVALSVKGDRIERDCEIELSAEEAAHLDPADITPVSGAPEKEPEEIPADLPLEDMDLAQLKERAKSLGLKTGGSKADLVERIGLNSGAPEKEPEEGDITSE